MVDVRPELRVADPRARRLDAARASTPRSRPRGSRSSTARPSSCSPDAYLANGSEPWLLPDVATLPTYRRPSSQPTRTTGERFCRTCATGQTLARPWAVPGTPGLEHRIGGLEKAGPHRRTSRYDPDNHDLMTRLRAQKVAGIAADIPELEVDDPDEDADLLVAWLGRHVRLDRRGRAPRAQANGGKVAHAHLHHLNPFPRNTGDVLRAYDRVLVPEMNLGQLLKLVRAEFLVDAVGYNRVRGKPFRADELETAMLSVLEEL